MSKPCNHRPPRQDKRLPKIDAQITKLYIQMARIRGHRAYHIPISEEYYNLQLDILHREVLRLRQLRLDYEPPH